MIIERFSSNDRKRPRRRRPHGHTNHMWQMMILMMVLGWIVRAVNIGTANVMDACCTSVAGLLCYPASHVVVFDSLTSFPLVLFSHSRIPHFSLTSSLRSSFYYKHSCSLVYHYHPSLSIYTLSLGTLLVMSNCIVPSPDNKVSKWETEWAVGGEGEKGTFGLWVYYTMWVCGCFRGCWLTQP